MSDKRFNNRNLKKAIDDSGMTREQIAESVGCDTSSITKYYNGNRYPKTDVIIKLAKLFNCSTDYLLGVSKAFTSDNELKFICDYTKLSELTIEHIQNMQAMFDYDIVNYLFECGAITDIVEVVYKAIKYADAYNPSQFQGKIITRIDDTVVDYFDLLMGNNKVQKELDLSEFNATRILQNAIEDLYLSCGAIDKSIQINRIIKESMATGETDE